MTLRAKNVSAYALIKNAPGKLSAKHVSAYALVALPASLPMGGSGKEELIRLIRSVAKEPNEDLVINFADPVQAINPPEGTNTMIRVSGDPSNTAGVVDFFYRRRHLQDLFLYPSERSVSLTGKVKTHDLLEWLSVVTKVVLSPIDIVNEDIQVVNGKVVIKAAPASYFFLPGTQLAIDVR